MAPPEGHSGALAKLLRAIARGLLALPRGAAFALVIAWLGVIRWLGQAHGGPMPRVTWYGWVLNTGHAALYGILVLWMLLLVARSRAWPAIDAYARRALLGSVLAFGLADEVIQVFASGRNASVLDLCTDLVGATCVMVIVTYLGRADANERVLRRLFVSSALLSMLSGALATVLPPLFPRVLWL